MAFHDAINLRIIPWVRTTMNRLSRTLVSSALRRPALPQQCRQLHLTLPRRNTALNNILAGGPAPAVQIKTITSEGIQLADGLTIPSACIFLEGKTYLWDVPQTLWDGWKNEHFDIFDVVVPKPEILLFGTGKRIALLPHPLRQHLTKIGIQVDIMDTWNACSTYNLLAEEGRRVAAALLPYNPQAWDRTRS